MVSFIAALGMFASLAAASYEEPIPTEVANRLKLHLGVAQGGALDLPPTPTNPAKVALGDDGPDTFRVTLLVAHTADITSIHVHPTQFPAPVGGNIWPGIIKNYGLGSFELPRGYEGNLALNNAGSFKNQNGRWTPDIDVSYVDGFSVPISCTCSAPAAGRHTSGCSKDLWSMNGCPDNNGHGSCKNPRRSQGWGHDATPFFAPCHRDYGGAYTFPADNGANSLNGDRCIDGYAFCCIGNLCSGYDDLDR